MIVDHQIVREIVSARHRRRALTLPIRRGSFGELKKCRMVRGGVYRLTERVPYRDCLTAAASEPTRARAVVRLLALCDRPRLTVTVTVVEQPVIADGVWHVRFVRGDKASVVRDDPVFLERGAGYTLQKSRALKGEPEVLTPFAEDLQRARSEALERRTTPNRDAVRRLNDAAGSLNKQMLSMKARNRVRLIEREAAKLAAELDMVPSEAADTVPASACVERQASVKADDGSRPNSTRSVVSLEPSA